MGTSKGKRAQSRGAGAIADGATPEPRGSPVQRTADVGTAAARGGYKGLTGPLNKNVIGIMTYSEHSQ